MAATGAMLPPDPDDANQLHQLIHELAQALTATTNYLHASQRLTVSGDFHSLALSKAIEQADRAGDVVSQLRSIVSKMEPA